MKNKLLDWIHHITLPMEIHAEKMLENLLNQLYEQTGSKLTIHKGQMLCLSSNNNKYSMVLLPSNLKALADDYLSYLSKIDKTRTSIYAHLSLVTKGKTLKRCTVLTYLPKNCHHLFDATAPVVDDIPDWLEQIVNESLMLRVLYEMS